uniref:Deacetylase sirtuin-type domain-containing protein n=1 Tax=Prymnesium polylepis TaxID=72548 RepID=A0A7S4KEK3_9EUKA
MTTLFASISAFDKGGLKPTETIQKDVVSFFGVTRDAAKTNADAPAAVMETTEPLQCTADSSLTLKQDIPLTATEDERHGCCFGFEDQRSKWAAPQLAVLSSAEARPGYNSMSASEYLDTEAVLRAKVGQLAALIRRSKTPIYYCGAGLSTSAGIGDYASNKASSITARPQPSLQDSLQQALANREASRTSYKSPLCAQPALGHRVLVGLHRAGHMHRLIQQNHDGLPQKAGLPQHVMNEIHGACHSPDNPVVPMSGALRTDLFDDLLECERTADLAVAVGTSLCGMNADRIASNTARRAGRDAAVGGTVLINLQRTVMDEHCQLRIFAPIDEVMALLAEELGVPVAPPQHAATPPPPTPCAGETDIFKVPCDADGRRSTSHTSVLDLRVGARLRIIGQPDWDVERCGTVATVTGKDSLGNYILQLPSGGDRRTRTLGAWWVREAQLGRVPLMPVAPWVG